MKHLYVFMAMLVVGAFFWGGPAAAGQMLLFLGGMGIVFFFMAEVD